MSDFVSRNVVIGCLYSTSESESIRRRIMELPAYDVKLVVRGGEYTPKPHGRLIDADALARQEAQAYEELSRNETDPWVTALYKALHRYLQSHLEQAPTVVPEVEAP